MIHYIVLLTALVALYAPVATPSIVCTTEDGELLVPDTAMRGFGSRREHQVSLLSAMIFVLDPGTYYEKKCKTYRIFFGVALA